MADAPFLAVVLAFAKRLVRRPMEYVGRLAAERNAARRGINPALLDEPIASSYARVSDATPHDGWWQAVSAATGRAVVRPNFLAKPAVQDWLAQAAVSDAFRKLTKLEVIGADTKSSSLRDFLAQRYADFTGEKAALAHGPIDRLIQILVAGCSYSLSPSDRFIAGAFQEMYRNFNQRFDALEAGRSAEVQEAISARELSRPNPETARASQELHTILSLRTFDRDLALKRIRRLLTRLQAGDLLAADQQCKEEIRYWAARLMATQSDTLALAQQIRDDIAEGNPETNLAAIDALAAETQGDPEAAMRIIRDKRDPDSRSVLFGLMMRHRGPAETLEWFDRQPDNDDVGFLSAAGWQMWAICTAKVSGPTILLSRLPLLEAHWEQIPGLALFEAAANAAMLIPEEFREAVWEHFPLYPGIRPAQGQAALARHERATRCIAFVRRVARGRVSDACDAELDGWHLWLQLMNPDAEPAKAASNDLSHQMTEGTKAVSAIAFAHAFEIDFPTEPLAYHLQERERLGGLNDSELAAEFLLNLRMMTPGEFAAYVTTNRERLLQVLVPDFVTAVHVQAVAESEGPEMAEQLVQEYGDLIGRDQSNRLGVMIAVQAGVDPRSQLEKNYRRTDQLTDLINLINFLKQSSDYEALLPLARSHFDRMRNVSNALDVVQCLLNTDPPDYQSAIRFLDDIPDLLGQSQDLVLARALALFHAGRLGDSRELNDAVLRDHMRPDSLRLDLGLAIALGDWDRIGEITTRAWEAHDQLAPHDLMRFAHVAASQDPAPDRALQFASAAVAAGGDDAAVLAGAYGLHFKVGRDRDADPAWLAKAVDLSSTADGPIWKFDLHEVTTNWLPEREARAREIEAKWLAGEIPIGLAASFFNVPLARLFLHTTDQNAIQPDGRRLSILPIISGTHTPADLQPAMTVGLDITSIFVLAYLDILELAIDSFDHVTLAPNTMERLFYERTEAAFHQPSRVDSAKTALRLHLSGTILVEDGQPADSQLIEEFGEELALLFERARITSGIVICVTPLHKPGTLLEQIADTTAIREILMSLSVFCELLRDAGHLSAQDFEQVNGLLQPRDLWIPPFTIADLERPILVDRLAFQYLLDSNILPALARSGIRLHIHDFVIREIRSLSDEGDAGRSLIDRIEAIRHVLREGIAAGRVSFAEQIQPVPQHRQATSGFEVMASLLGASQDCDAILVDDRFVNKFPMVESSNGSSTPVACVLDLLRLLLAQDKIDEHQQLAARQKLRQGGFAFIPLVSDDLLKPVSTVHLDDNARVIESRELTVLRQTAARMHSLDFATPEESLTLSASTKQAAVVTIQALWETERTTQTASSRSDWVWDNVIALSLPNLSVISQPTNSTFIGDLLSVRTGMLLLPLPTWPEDLHLRYLQWIDAIIARLLPANSDKIEGALRSAREAISGLDVNQAAYGNLFFARLPESARTKMTDLFPDFATICGIELAEVLSIGPDVKLPALDLLRSAARLLDSRTPQSLSTLDEASIRLMLNDADEVSIELPTSDDGQPNLVAMPHLNLLSPNVQVRAATLAMIVHSLGPTTDYTSLAAAINTRKPIPEEMSQILSDLSSGVGALQSRLAQRLRLGQPVQYSDFAPDSLTYFDLAVGPRPNEPSPDAYVADVLTPYRRQLISRDLVRGLEICCHGAVHPSLLPAPWLTDFSDNDLWGAVESIGTAGSPYFLLALLDISLARRGDARFEHHAETLVSLLLDLDSDNYELLPLFFQLVFNQINLLENGTGLPPFWKRLAAWTQAGVCIRAIASTNSLNLAGLADWIRDGFTTAGHYANLVDGRVEPMILASRASKSLLQARTLLTLHALCAHHDPESIGLPGIDQINDCLSKNTEQLGPGTYIPGPLAGHARPVESPDTDLKSQFLGSPHRDAGQLMSGLMLASQVFRLGESDLEWAAGLVQSHEPPSGVHSVSELMALLDPAAVVAAASRNVPLADAIADAVVRAARDVTDDEIPALTPLLLNAASAHDNDDNWFAWLESQFARVAANLPGPPRGALRLFLDCLYQLEIALPTERWFHLRAKSIALAGSSSPPIHTKVSDDDIE